MPKRIFIGGLSIQTTSEELEKMFAGVARPAAIRLAASEDGQSRTAYVIMDSDSDAEAAIKRLNGQELHGRKIVVKDAESGDDSPVRL